MTRILAAAAAAAVLVLGLALTSLADGVPARLTVAGKLPPGIIIGTYCHHRLIRRNELVNVQYRVTSGVFDQLQFGQSWLHQGTFVSRYVYGTC